MKRLILGFAVAAVLSVGVSTAWADFTCVCYHPVSFEPDGSYPIYVEMSGPGDPCREVFPNSATVTVLDGGVHYCS